ncbi:hypothetical protein ROTAS13_03522 [Roseomonas sp. TAS13]|nr:hypothetical protein ROTAS13_03522 [Roseomonas sp. TAS13]
MGDVEERDAEPVAQPRQERQDLRLARGIQRGQGLVHQQQAGARQQGTAQGDTLPLAAGQRGGAAAQQMADAEQRHHLLETGSVHAARCPAQPVAQVGVHRKMREEPRILEDHAAAPLFRRQHAPRRAVEQHHAIQRDPPFPRAQQPGHRGEQGGLAAARGAEDRRDARCRRSEGRIDGKARHVRGGGGKAVAQADFQHQPRRLGAPGGAARPDGRGISAAPGRA